MGVRVEGYTVGGETRHINSAFFTFRLADNAVTLAQLLLQTKVHTHNALCMHSCVAFIRDPVWFTI